MYKRQIERRVRRVGELGLRHRFGHRADRQALIGRRQEGACLLYTSDAADERSSVDLGGRRIIKKKKTEQY